MDFAIVIAENGPGSEPECLFVGTDAAQAERIYQAHSAGQVSFFRLYRTQAYESRDMSIRHGIVSGTAKPPVPVLAHPVNASDLPGPKHGEIIHDITTGQDLIRPAANPHQVNVLPTDPVARAAAIKEAEDYRDAALKVETAPADPEKAKLIADEHDAAETKLADKLKDSPLLPTKTTSKAARVAPDAVAAPPAMVVPVK